jgi:hypothetical protein
MEEQNDFRNTFNQRVSVQTDCHNCISTAVIFPTSVALNAALLHRIQQLAPLTFASTPTILSEICCTRISQHPYTQMPGRYPKLRHECFHIIYILSFTNVVSFCVYRDTPLTGSLNTPQINTLNEYEAAQVPCKYVVITYIHSLSGLRRRSAGTWLWARVFTSICRHGNGRVN